MENSELNTKLIINLRDGIVEAEGNEEFVRAIYEDFKEQISRTVVLSSKREKGEILQLESETLSPDNPAKPSHKKSAGRVKNGDGKRSNSGTYKPKFNSQLDLSGLETFYDKFQLTKHAEKILIFSVYLRDHLKMSSFSADDIFTCYFAMKHKTDVPEAFWQAFRDTKSRTHFIEYNSPEKIELTIAGDNHFSKMMREIAQKEKTDEQN